MEDTKEVGRPCKNPVEFRREKSREVLHWDWVVEHPLDEELHFARGQRRERETSIVVGMVKNTGPTVRTSFEFH